MFCINICSFLWNSFWFLHYAFFMWYSNFVEAVLFSSCNRTSIYETIIEFKLAKLMKTCEKLFWTWKKLICYRMRQQLLTILLFSMTDSIENCALHTIRCSISFIIITQGSISISFNMVSFINSKQNKNFSTIYLRFSKLFSSTPMEILGLRQENKENNTRSWVKWFICIKISNKCIVTKF